MPSHSKVHTGFRRKIQQLVTRMSKLDTALRFKHETPSGGRMPLTIKVKYKGSRYKYTFVFQKDKEAILVTCGTVKVARFSNFRAEATNELLARIIRWHFLTLTEDQIAKQGSKRFHQRIDKEEGELVLEEHGMEFRYGMTVTFYTPYYSQTKPFYRVELRHGKTAPEFEMGCHSLNCPKLIPYGLAHAAKESAWQAFSIGTLSALELLLQAQGFKTTRSDDDADTLKAIIYKDTTVGIELPRKKPDHFDLDFNDLITMHQGSQEYALTLKLLNFLAPLTPQDLTNQVKPELAVDAAPSPVISTELDLV